MVVAPDGNVDVIVDTNDRPDVEVDCPPAEQPVIDTAVPKELVRLGEGREQLPGDVSALLIPPAACKTAEEDESHQSDDETDPEAPKDQQKDPDDDDDPTEGEPAPRTEATLPCSHAFLLLSC
jgi:hypothetical protein